MYLRGVPEVLGWQIKEWLKGRGSAGGVLVNIRRGVVVIRRGLAVNIHTRIVVLHLRVR